MRVWNDITIFKLFSVLTTLALLTSLSTSAYSQAASSRDLAYKIHNRIAGIPPSAEVLDQMAALLDAGNGKAAIDIPLATEAFLAITVKSMALSWTNVDEKIDVPLNDFSATVIGMIRDNLPFDQILYADMIYTAQDGMANVPAYSGANNEHYAAFDEQGGSYLNQLVRKPQTGTTGLPVAAGALTTRGWGEAYYQAGTNRRSTQFTLKTFLCKEMEQLTDNTRPDLYVRRDVDRLPGGDATEYKSKCSGCHSGMDPLTKAFAFFDFVDGAIVYTPGQTPDKVNRNGETFPGGYVTADDEWVNMWIQGQNSSFGWNGEPKGNGPQSFGAYISRTDEFARCMAKKVYHQSCITELEDEATINRLADAFKADGYKIKSLFSQAIQTCEGVK